MEYGTYYKVKYANNVSTHLAKKLDFTDTTCEVLPLEDKKTTWPYLADTPNSFFMCALVGKDNTYEIVKCTSYTIDDTTKNVVLTIERAQDGTEAQTFPEGTLIENRITAGILNERLNYIVEGVIPGPSGEKGDPGDPGIPGPQGPPGIPGDGYPDIATETTVGLGKPDNDTIRIDSSGTYSVAHKGIGYSVTTPSEKTELVIFSGEANTLMYWDDALRLYRSTTPVDIFYSMHSESTLPFGMYHANGRSVGTTTREGKILGSLPSSVKRDWGIVLSQDGTTITLPSMYNIDGRGFYTRAGILPGIAQTDAVRNVTGTFTSAGRTGLFSIDSTGVFSSTEVVPITTIAYTEGPNSASIDFDLSRVVPTADEVRVLTKSMLPVIYLGV